MKKIFEWEDLSKFERAIIILARHIERCPSNEYNVLNEILDTLELEKLAPRDASSPTH